MAQDFMAGRRQQSAARQTAAKLQTFNLDQILRQQEASTKRATQGAKHTPADGTLAARVAESRGSYKTADDFRAQGDADSGSLLGKLARGAWDIGMGKGALGKATAHINPYAQYRIIREDVPGGEQATDQAVNALDYGRRGAVLALDEGSKLLDDNKAIQDFMLATPAGFTTAAYSKWAHDKEASADRSVGERLADPRYGFGDITKSTGNRVADSAIGFAGDVALDPATYLTLGSTKFAGAAGRIAAVERLQKANAASVAAGGAQLFAQEGIEKVAKYGVSHADDAMRAQLKLGDSGVRWAGYRVPGTGAIGRETGTALSEARAGVMQGNVGKAVSWMRSDSRLKHNLDIVAGRVDGNVDEAIGFLTSGDVGRSVGGRVIMETRDEELGQVLRQAKSEGRIAGTHALEEGVEIPGLTDATRTIFNQLFDMGQKFGVTGQKFRANYVPHFLTRPGKDALRGVVKATKRTTHKVNTAQSRGASFSRSFKKGDYYVPNPQTGEMTKVTLENGSIREVNEKIGAVTGVKIFEDDLALILERAIQEASQEIGIAAQLEQLKRTHPQYVKAFNEVAGDAEVPSTMDAQLLKGSAKTPGGLTTEPDTLFTATKSQRANARRRAKTVEDAVDAGWSTKVDDAFFQAAKSGKLGPRISAMIDEGFDKIESQMHALGQEVLATPQTRASFERIAKAAEDPAFSGILAAYMDFTRLFKGYATMTPGFHVRNGLSALFMNVSDGVGAQDHKDGFRIMNFLHDGGKIEDLPLHEQHALHMTLGTGVNGALSNSETRITQQGRGGIDALSAKGGAREKVATVLNRADTNWAQSLHRDIGSMRVEGPMRLAVALNTVKRGAREGVDSADLLSEGMARITRLHFDYSQASNLDQVAKSVIPFWTFMSRNIPLQLQQQFMRPKAYSMYAAVRDNFDLSEEGDMPGWLSGKGTAALGGGIYASPDLPFTDLAGDSRSFTQLQGEDGGLLQSLNPIPKLAYEFGTGRKTFGDRVFREDENRWLYGLKSLIPPLATFDRLSGNNITNAVEGQFNDGDGIKFDGERSLNAALGLTGLGFSKRDPDKLREQAFNEQLRALNASNG